MSDLYNTPRKRQRSNSSNNSPVSSLSTGISSVPTLVDTPLGDVSPSTPATVTSQMSPGEQQALGLQHQAYTVYHTLYKKIHLEDMGIMIANQHDKRVYPNLFVFDEMDNNEKNDAINGIMQAYKLDTNTDTFYPVIWDSNNDRFVGQENLNFNQSLNSSESFYSSNDLGPLMSQESLSTNAPIVTDYSSLAASASDSGRSSLTGGKRKSKRRKSKKNLKKRNKKSRRKP